MSVKPPIPLAGIGHHHDAERPAMKYQMVQQPQSFRLVPGTICLTEKGAYKDRTSLPQFSIYGMPNYLLKNIDRIIASHEYNRIKIHAEEAIGAAIKIGLEDINARDEKDNWRILYTLASGRNQAYGDDDDWAMIQSYASGFNFTVEDCDLGTRTKKVRISENILSSLHGASHDFGDAISASRLAVISVLISLCGEPDAMYRDQIKATADRFFRKLAKRTLVMGSIIRVYERCGMSLTPELESHLQVLGI